MMSPAVIPGIRNLLGLPCRERPEEDAAGFPPSEPKGQEPAKNLPETRGAGAGRSECRRRSG